MMASEFNAKASRAKRPCPLWVDAFQRDTQHLEADEIGAYMLLLMAMWTRESCDFPNDDTRLARVCRVSLRLWKSRVGPVLRDFLKAEGDVLVSKRLRQEAEYVETEVQKQSDRKRGAYAKPQGSNERDRDEGEKSDKALKSHDTMSSADSSVDQPRHYPSQQPNNPTLVTAADAAREARDGDLGADPPTFRERILEAIGADPVSGLTGPSGKVIGTQADMAIARRWLALPGLTEDAIIAEIRAISARRRGGKLPSTFRYFSGAMEDLSGALTAPALRPSQGPAGQAGSNNNPRHARQQAVIEAAARGTTNGEEWG